MWRQRRGWRKTWREPKSFWLTRRLCWTTWRVTPPARGRSHSSKIKCVTLLNTLLRLSRWLWYTYWYNKHTFSTLLSFPCISRIYVSLILANVCPSPPPRYLFPSSCFSQLEESEFTCAAAVKARKSMENEIEDLHIQMEDVVKAKMSVSFDIC